MWTRSLAAILLVTVATACTTPARTSTTQEPSDSTTSVRRNVVIGIEAEIDNLSSKLGGGTNAAEYNFLSNSPLMLLDEKGVASPFLAADQPTQANGTWIVNPDSTMQTTWRIRPNATWHDGRNVVSDDFIFALTVYMDPALPVADRTPEQFMDRIEALDEKTFVIHWKETYPWANELIARDLEPLPAHIMRPVFDQGDSDAFINHGFWSSTDYIGNGPYRLVQWEAGTQLVYRAFDGFFLARPGIDEVIVRIIPDTNTFVANLLGGEVDASVGSSFGAIAAATVRDRWAETGEGQMLGSPVRFRHTQIQFNPEWLEQPALLNRQVRQAIVHGIDREALAQTVSVGLSHATDTFLTPQDPRYEDAQRAIAKYPYDPRRALSLLEQAGWTRQGDRLINGSGQQFQLDVRTTQGTDSETEASIMAADLRRLGTAMTETVVPSSRVRDSEYRVKFPGLNTTALSIQVPGTLRRAVSAECPDPARRYTGGNRGCWTNAQFDELYLAASTSLDPRERDQAIVQALTILTEDVGLFGLSYVTENIAVRKGLVGPGPRWPGQIGSTWNVHAWRWA